MKIRRGFVSNSSSSSFLIFVDKKPATIEETQKLFLGDDEFYPNPYHDPDSSYFNDRPASYPAKVVASDVFESLKFCAPSAFDTM